MEQEKLYQRGFNAGYLLAIHEPILIEKLLKSDNSNNEYFEGLLLGKKQHDREIFKQDLDRMKNQNSQNKELER
jgi:hypothetical protein